MQGTVKVAEFFRSSISVVLSVSVTLQLSAIHAASAWFLTLAHSWTNGFYYKKKTKKKQHCVILLHDTARWSVKRKKRKTGVNSDWRMDLLNLSRLAIEAGGWAEVGS